MKLYPMLTDALIEKSEIGTTSYALSYRLGEKEYQLSYDEDKYEYKIKDISNPWTIENDGLLLERNITVENPSALFGPAGIIPTGAELGWCIKWRNTGTTSAGVILPVNVDADDDFIFVEFSHLFPSGTITGNIELSTELYVKKKAGSLASGETHLMNYEGVTLGCIDEITVVAGNDYMVFPIEEVTDPNEPIWWVRFSDWDNPLIDKFSSDNVCVFLNRAHSACPSIGDQIFNAELLIDILSQVYCMMFKRLTKEDLKAITDGEGLEVNSIGYILHHLYSQCTKPLHPEADPEKLTKELLVNLNILLLGGGTAE